MKKVIGLFAILLVVIGFSSCQQQMADKPSGASMKATGPVKVDFAEAEMHIGEEATVCGEVLGTKVYEDFGGTAVISVGAPSETPGGFHCAAQPENAAMFEPLNQYMNKQICIKGMIEENPFGGATISLVDPSQIEIQ